MTKQEELRRLQSEWEEAKGHLDVIRVRIDNLAQQIAEENLPTAALITVSKKGIKISQIGVSLRYNTRPYPSCIAHEVSSLLMNTNVLLDGELVITILPSK